jgi:hypothetical protein
LRDGFTPRPQWDKHIFVENCGFQRYHAFFERISLKELEPLE